MGALEELVKALVLEDTAPNFAANDPYLAGVQLSNQLSGAIPVQSDDYGLGEKMAAAALTGLLGGAASQASEDYQSKQKELFKTALLKSFGGDTSEVEGLEPSLFDIASEKGTALSMFDVLEDKRAGEQLQGQKSLKLFEAMLQNPYRAKKALEMMGQQKAPIATTADESSADTAKNTAATAEAAATKEPIAISADSQNRVTPTAKPGTAARMDQLLEETLGDEAAARTRFEKEAAQPEEFAKDAREALRSGKLTTDFGDLQSNFKTMLDTYKFDDRPATTALIASFARVMDPGSTTREGEIKNAENTQSFFDKIGYSLQSVFSGEQQIGPDVKQEMIRAAGAKYNTFGGAYTSYLTKQQELVASKGGKKDEVFGPYTYEPFDFNSWAKTATQMTLEEQLGGDGAVPKALENKMRLITQKRRAGGTLSADEQAIVDQVRRMVTGGKP